MQPKAVIALEQRVAAKMLERLLPAQGIEPDIFGGSAAEIAPYIESVRPEILFLTASRVGDILISLSATLGDKFSELAIVAVSEDAEERRQAAAGRVSATLPVPVNEARLHEVITRCSKHAPVVLHVDDSRLEHSATGALMRGEGFVVHEAHNGAEGLRRLGELDAVDVVVSDLQMPVMDGYAFCKAIKENERFHHIPVILKSSLASESDIARGFEVGADDYLVKPVVAPELISRIKRQLNAHSDMRPERILVCTDDAAMARNLVRGLSGQGFGVELTGEGPEMLTCLSRTRYDLLIMQVSESSVDLLRRMRRLQHAASLPVMAVGDRRKRALQVRISSLGISAFVAAPFSGDRLVAEVERLLAQDRLMRQTEAMRRYLSEAAVGAVVTGARARSEEEHRTILFCDIVSFTQMCSTIPAREMISVVNSFFDAMVEELARHGGMIDKFIGDAIMALFDGRQVGALGAVRASLAMLEAMPAVRKKVGLDLHIRIGINSGVVVVGDLGSVHHRVDYTVIGDNVNIAQRLESSAPTDSILISGATYDLVADAIEVDELPPMKLKGRELPVRAYRVLRTVG